MKGRGLTAPPFSLYASINQLNENSEGTHVICLDIKDCKETLHRITSAGGSAETAVMDVTQLSEWKHQVNKVLKDHGHIDILANIAGVVAQTADTSVELEEAEWDRVIGIDLKGVWLGMKTVIPSMIEKRYGRILNIASLAALRGLPNLFSYSTAKVGSRPSLDWEHHETLPIWLRTSRHPKQNSSLVRLFLATAVGRQNKKCGA